MKIVIETISHGEQRYDTLGDYFIDEDDKYKTIYLNEDMENIKANIKKRSDCVYMYSKNIERHSVVVLVAEEDQTTID